MMHSTQNEIARALLIGTDFISGSRAETDDLLVELEELCRTIELEPVQTQSLRLQSPHPRFYIGSGKLDEMLSIAEDLNCDCIVFDDELSPSQQRNLERHTKLAVIDRREVILEIFKQRASTPEAVLQVQLASLQYSLPRLTRAWTHLNRQRGGAKGTRGEGEKQLEVDRRLVQKKIASVKQQLVQIERRRASMRKQRERVPVPTGALVGYTNAGKSSLLERLSGQSLDSKDALFATLDPSTKRVELPKLGHVLLTDTVGFVRNLPHELVDAFHSTLEETLHASFIIHVVDASAYNAAQQYKTVMNVLRELGAGDYPIITVLNKADLLPAEELFTPDIEGPKLAISAKTGQGIDQLYFLIEGLLEQRLKRQTFCFPSGRSDLAALIHRNGQVLSEQYEDDGIHITALVPGEIQGKLAQYLQKSF